MQVTVEGGEGLQRRMTVEVAEELIGPEVEKRLQSMRSTVRLAGFRPGKVPMGVMKRNFGRRVRGEVASGVLQKSFSEAVVQEGLRPAGAPQIDAIQSEPGSGLSYTAVFEVYPEVAVPDVASLPLSRPVAEVTEEDVDRMIQTLRQQRRTWSEVEREAVVGDRVVIDYTGTIEGEPFPGNEGKEMPVELGAGKMVEGFESGLVGLRAGADRELVVTFPESYHSAAVAGRTAVFKARVLRVEEAELPEVDEAFAEAYGVREGGTEALRSEVRANMERELADALQAKVRKEVMDALLEANPLQVPRALVDEEAKRMADQARSQLGREGTGLPEDALPPESFVESARRRVALGMLLAEVVRAQDLKADPDRVRERVESVASTYEDPSEVVNWYYASEARLSEVESVVMEDQIVQWCLDHAQVTERRVTFDDIMNPGQTSQT